jgi:hypothetical protein
MVARASYIGWLVWGVSLLLGVITWGVWLGVALAGGRDYEGGLLRVLVTCYTAPAGLTLAIAAYVRKRGVKELLSVIVSGVYSSLLALVGGGLIIASFLDVLRAI